MYTLLNMMSVRGIDAYRTASVLGYCLLPMVGLGTLGMGVGMECVLSRPGRNWSSHLSLSD